MNLVKNMKKEYFLLMGAVDRSDYLLVNFKQNKGSVSRRGLTYGFGLNDAPYMVTPRIDGSQVICPAYLHWRNMIKRSCSHSFKNKHKTYRVVSVCDEWLSFMAFRAWWINNYVDGYELDKDLISDGTLYSEESCRFIPDWLNRFTTDRRSERGEYMIGVSFCKKTGRFQSRISNPLTKKHESIGYFSSENDAYLAWLNKKIEIATSMRDKMDSIDENIFPRVLELINSAR